MLDNLNMHDGDPIAPVIAKELGIPETPSDDKKKHTDRSWNVWHASTQFVVESNRKDLWRDLTSGDAKR